MVEGRDRGISGKLVVGAVWVRAFPSRAPRAFALLASSEALPMQEGLLHISTAFPSSFAMAPIVSRVSGAPHT